MSKTQRAASRLRKATDSVYTETAHQQRPPAVMETDQVTGYQRGLYATPTGGYEWRFFSSPSSFLLSLLLLLFVLRILFIFLLLFLLFNIEILMRMCSGVPNSFEAPWTVNHQAPLSTGFSRQEYWSGLLFPSPGHLPNPGIKPTSLVTPALAGGFFTTTATWEAS